MAVLPFRQTPKATPRDAAVGRALQGFSIEVMPHTAARIDDFRALLPPKSRVYVAHIAGTPIDDMIGTAARLRREGFAVMPHIPARLIPDTSSLKRWVERYRTEADVSEALILGGSPKAPLGAFDNAMQLLQTGLFQEAGFTRLHVAGHPEGSRDIDPGGGTANVDAALRAKQDWAAATGVDMAIVTQFAFESAAVIDWAKRLRGDGITLPIHLGVAGPAKLQTLIKFAIACGVGPSLKVLQKRARDIGKLVVPFEPDELLRDASTARGANGALLFEQMHLFPLGGITASTRYVARHGAVPHADKTAQHPHSTLVQP